MMAYLAKSLNIVLYFSFPHLLLLSEDMALIFRELGAITWLFILVHFASNKLTINQLSSPTFRWEIFTAHLYSKYSNAYSDGQIIFCQALYLP